MDLEKAGVTTTLIGFMLVFWLSAYDGGALVPAMFSGMAGVLLGVWGTVIHLDDIDDE